MTGQKCRTDSDFSVRLHGGVTQCLSIEDECCPDAKPSRAATSRAFPKVPAGGVTATMPVAISGLMSGLARLRLYRW